VSVINPMVPVQPVHRCHRRQAKVLAACVVHSMSAILRWECMPHDVHSQDCHAFSLVIPIQEDLPSAYIFEGMPSFEEFEESCSVSFVDRYSNLRNCGTVEGEGRKAD